MCESRLAGERADPESRDDKQIEIPGSLAQRKIAKAILSRARAPE
jgi:hypothetical protein